MYAIIGGSGLGALAALANPQARQVTTPYGPSSAPVVVGELGGHELAFVARHGPGHSTPPHRINYRANLWALKQLRVEGIFALATVGGIRAELGPGTLAVAHQLIDYTHGRDATFFEGPDTPVTHVDFTHPYSARLRTALLAAGRALGETLVDGAVYACTQGPRLETAAEIERLARDGADLVGMTGMPEAVLAREAGLDYAALCVVVNHAAGRGDSRHEIRIEAIEEAMRAGVRRAVAVIEQALAEVRR